MVRGLALSRDDLVRRAVIMALMYFSNVPARCDTTPNSLSGIDPHSASDAVIVSIVMPPSVFASPTAPESRGHPGCAEPHELNTSSDTIVNDAPVSSRKPYVVPATLSSVRGNPCGFETGISMAEPLGFNTPVRAMVNSAAG